MKFVVVGHDGKDEKALERRMAVREAHMALGKELTDKGHWIYACAILDDNETMIGSIVVCDFPDQEALYKEWLDKEVYLSGGVWKEVTVNRAAIPPFFQ